MTTIAKSETTSAPSLPEVMVKPTLEELPVYVREGSFIPMQPLVQNTSEKPSGPLVLRVYPGDGCRGSLYQDDGTSFGYRQGEFLAMDFSCNLEPDRLLVHLSKHSGSFPAWWKEVQLEVYGATSASPNVTAANGVRLSNTFDETHNRQIIIVPDNGNGIDLRIENYNQSKSSISSPIP
jgi:alpha-glucosidase